MAYYARVLDRSSEQLARELHGAVGRPPKQLILDRLMLEARRLLSFSALPIKDIADQLGFRDPYQFSHLFKQLEGCSPLAFREAGRPAPTKN